METVFSLTSFRHSPDEVIDAARTDLVRITDNGPETYIFASEEVYERKIREAVEDAAYLARVSAAIERGRADIEAGRFTTSIEEAFERPPVDFSGPEYD